MDIAQLLTILFGIFAGIAVGFSYISYRLKRANMEMTLEKENINRLLEEARTQQKEIILQAKDETYQLRQEVEAELKERRAELTRLEQRLQQKEENLERKLENQEQRERNLFERERELDRARLEIEESRNRQIYELERIAGMTADQAREVLMGRMESEARQYASSIVHRIEEEAREKGDEKARKILSVAVSRLASDYVSEATVSTVVLPSDEMKGRIIGREGRNIRAFEAATGVDLIVDDTPEAVTLSCFDGVRREVARRALNKLIADGRIHQARIEEVVGKSRQELEQELLEDGEKAALEVGVTGVHPDILKLVGRLKYRTSYGQNQYYHAIEASHLAGVIATELNADINVAKAGALLHDIGKVMDHQIEGSHAVIGANLIRRLMKNEAVAHAVGAHHSDEDPLTVESWIVMAADAMSGGRPGARREQVETYIRRLEALEQMAGSFAGVERCFAIQAGREIRILVRPEMVDDVTAMRMARDLSKQIEENLQYPGQIKVTIIRETRAVDYAR
ncbi:MAG TPA: ribonuclease Y [Chloroflexia bacterium]|nr:ribonuclease Y [Chloroflexia bacterium]